MSLEMLKDECRYEGRAEGRAEGRMEGRAEGRMEAEQSIIEKMRRSGMTQEQIQMVMCS